MKISVRKGNTFLYDLTIMDEDLINGGEIFVGREEDCHIVLESQQISRHHFTLKVENKLLFVDVLSQFGGVKLNGNQIKKSAIEEGSQIEIGEFSLVLSGVGTLLSFLNPAPAPEPELEAFMEETIVEVPEDDIPAKEEFAEEELVPIDDIEDTIIDEPEDTPLEESEDLDEIDSDVESDFSNEGTEVNDVDDFSSSEDSENNFEENNDDFNEGSDDAFSEGDSFGDGDAFGDDSFGDDGFGGDSFGDDFGGGGDVMEDETESTQVFQSFANFYLKLFSGEIEVPFSSFKIEDAETKIGRDANKCQIVLNDPEVSGVHAIIKKTLINCTIEDNDSSNGIIYNGERVNKAELSNGDEFIIGDTTFTVGISSDIIEAERDVLMPVEANQEVEIEEIIEEEVGYDEFNDGAGDEEEEKSFLKKIWKDKRKRFYLLAGIGVLALVLLLGEDDPKPKPVVKKKPAKKVEKPNTGKYRPEVLEKLEANYALAQARFSENNILEAKEYIQKVQAIDPGFKKTPTLARLIEEKNAALIKQKRREAEAKERLERQLKIKALVAKAAKAVKERNINLAKGLFSQINELDPENPDVPSLRLEIEAYEAEVLRKKQEEELKRARRQGIVNKLAPGKTLYLRGEWYKAIDRLETFIKEKDMDEDLLQEATKMLKDSQRKLQQIIGPLSSKARSFKEGQDLKQAYETYGEILRYDPSNEESLNERDNIFKTLKNRSKKLYREALVAESLSLFEKAKEKFQEVKQISPINSEYYNKATDKLKNYLE